MGITARLLLQGAATRPLAGELASAVTFCVFTNSASLEPVTCRAVQIRSGQVGGIRKQIQGKRIQGRLRTTATCALFYGCVGTTTGRQFYLVKFIKLSCCSHLSSFPKIALCILSTLDFLFVHILIPKFVQFFYDTTIFF
jgi:hypothetical protein